MLFHSTKNTFICLMGVATLALCASCEKFKEQNKTTENISIFKMAFEGVPDSYKDFLERGGDYFVEGPQEASESYQKEGWKRKYRCGLKQTNGTAWVYFIDYYENDETTMIEGINIYQPNDDLPLSKYIGKKRSVILEAFAPYKNTKITNDEIVLSFYRKDMCINCAPKRNNTIAFMYIDIYDDAYRNEFLPDNLEGYYKLSKNYYWGNDKPEFIGRAMNFAYQKYSGVKTPVIAYPTYGYIRKDVMDSLDFKNISTKTISKAKIFFHGIDETEDRTLFVTFDDFDFIPGSNCTVKLQDNFLKMEDEYIIDKITFYFDDETEQTVTNAELKEDHSLIPIDLTGSGTFYVKDPGNGYFYFVVKTKPADPECIGAEYKITLTNQNDEETVIEGDIPYWDDDEIFSYNIWNKMPIEQFCDLKKLKIEFNEDGKILKEEVTNPAQLEKITMWIYAFAYYGYR